MLLASQELSLADAFEQEMRLRKEFNITCISYVKSLHPDVDSISMLPEGYSVFSILTDVITKGIESHRSVRIKLLRISIFISGLSLLKKPDSRNKLQKSIFVFISKISIVYFFLKSIIANFIRTFYQLVLPNMDSEKLLVCVNFPWYSFVEHEYDAASSSMDANKCENIKMTLGLANYILSSYELAKSKVISINEYHLDFWQSDAGLHNDKLLPRIKVNRRPGNLFIIFQQINNQFINLKMVFKFMPSFKNNKGIDKLIILLGLVKYFTQSPEIYGFLKELKLKNINLLINANEFYCFPWYANVIEKKSHYMYSENSCYFPFSYFSPAKKFIKEPLLNKSRDLLYGFLEWPLYFRSSGNFDIGYHGVMKLTNAVMRREGDDKHISEPVETIPLQLGSIIRFNDIEKSDILDKSIKDKGKKSILFLDSLTYSNDQQLTIFDVPYFFCSKKITMLYYQTLLEYVNQHNLSLLIRPKYRINRILDSVINELSSRERESINFMSSMASLQDVLNEVDPSILLIKPMSSTYFFTLNLGFQPKYFIPDKLVNIFDELNDSMSDKKINYREQWVTEKDLLPVIQ